MPLMMYGETDQGLVRSSNQDAFFFSKEYGVVIVSDGMGGHKGGEIASRLAVDGLRDAFLATSQILPENVGSFLDDVLRNINAEILRQSEENEKLRGMGATINYLQFACGMVAIGHAGDSRTYLLRTEKKENGEIQCHMWQLTIDHNVGTFVERGLLKLGGKEKTLTDRQKSRLMRGMGVMADLKADLYTRQLQDGDILLTCSDGLHGYVSEDSIVQTICAGPLSEAPQRLIALVKSAGAPDNVTVVVSAWGEHEEPLIEPSNNAPNNACFLVRMRDGTVIGPFDVNEVIHKWTHGTIPVEAETSAYGRPWVFFRKYKLLCETYSDFDTPAVKRYISQMAPPSTTAPSTLTVRAQNAFSRASFRTRMTWILIAAIFATVLTLFVFTWMEWQTLRDTTLF